jgi:hypothetical protein
MLTRSAKSEVTFFNKVMIGDSQRLLPAGTYECVVEEELILGLSFKVYRCTAICLMVQGRCRTAGQTTNQMTTKEELEHAIECDRTLSKTTNDSEAALSPQKDMT